MTEQIKYIPARLKSAVKGGHVTGAEDIDAGGGKTQQKVNDEVDDTLALHQSEISGLNSQNYVTVETYASLPATGAVNTIYRVSSYDGTQVDATKYAEYAWNGGAYVLLDVKTQVGEVFDISQYKAVGGTLATFANLTAALDSGNNVPSGLRKGGMSVKFVQSSDNKYVQFFCTANDFTTDVTQWKGVDDEPTANSDNLVNSDGIFLNHSIYESVIFLDLSSPTIGYYYSAGGVTTGNQEYCCKEIDISEYAGKKLRIRCGYYGSYGVSTILKFCYIKFNDNSYAELGNYVQKYVKSYVGLVKIPTNASKLQVSWNFSGATKVKPVVAFSEIDSFDSISNTFNAALSKTANRITLSNVVTNNIVKDDESLVKEEIAPTQTFPDVAIYQDGSFRTANGYLVAEFDVTNKNYVKVTSQQGDSNFISILSYDSRGEIIQAIKYERGGHTDNILLYLGTVKIRVTQYGSASNIGVLYEDKYTNIASSIKELPSKTSDYINVVPSERKKYYSAGGTMSSNSDWDCAEIDISSYAGKALRIRGGYLSQTYGENYLKYSYIRKNNNSYVALDSCDKIKLSNSYIVKLPDDASVLEFSWDARSISSVVPILQYSASDNILFGDSTHLVPINKTNPLKEIVRTSTYASIINDWGFIGDSLSSGTMECFEGSTRKYIDMYEYSWPQRFLKINGVDGYNFTQGGMSTRAWINGNTERTWDASGANNGASVNPKKGYCIYLAANDSYIYHTDAEIGTTADININDYTQNPDTYVGNYGGIIQRLKSIQPKAKIFCITSLRNLTKFNTQIRNIVTFFQNIYPNDIYLVDLMAYAPINLYTQDNGYNLNGHNSALGYQYIAYCVSTYIDWIIRSNVLSFKNVSLIGTNYTTDPT